MGLHDNGMHFICFRRALCHSSAIYLAYGPSCHAI